VTAGHAGTAQLKQFHMENIDMWRHPKYYKELRKLRNKLDQAISTSDSTECSDKRAPGPGLKQQAASDKQTRTSSGSATSKPQASSDKLQAQNNKPQASSLK
jgi:hypothetical protein